MKLGGLLRAFYSKRGSGAIGLHRFLMDLKSHTHYATLYRGTALFVLVERTP